MEPSSEARNSWAGVRARNSSLSSKRSKPQAAGLSVERSTRAKEDEVVKLMADADAHAPLEVCVFNIGANVNFPILETTERVFRKVWEMACYAGFLAGREAARHMLARGKGKIFFTDVDFVAFHDEGGTGGAVCGRNAAIQRIRTLAVEMSRSVSGVIGKKPLRVFG
jgi:NAD(P)-dependent dehydrogenase (short-subunit alcohol dehydrogenase family)